MTIKTLYLARHAKSAWDTDAASDFERPLSQRGLRDARRIGGSLKQLGWQPQRIIASPAIRAKQTCHVYCEALSVLPQSVIWNRDIYAAYLVSLLHMLSKQPESIRSVMLIGHNPALEDVLVHLCGDALWRTHSQKNGKLLTTGNVAKIVLDADWKDLVMCEARLVQLLRPKELS